MKPIDDPENSRLHRVHKQRLISRDIDKLLGICEFSLQDGCIDQFEAESILVWLNAHKGCLDTWPASILYDRLSKALADGVLDNDEQSDLLSLIAGIARPITDTSKAAPASLPINDPIPEIVVPGRSFCFTGVFDFGSRSDCSLAVSARNGILATSITKKLDYLVIGNIGSDVWKHTSFGNKILKAVSYRDAGVPIAIIPEHEWAIAVL